MRSDWTHPGGTRAGTGLLLYARLPLHLLGPLAPWDCIGYELLHLLFVGLMKYDYVQDKMTAVLDAASGLKAWMRRVRMRPRSSAGQA